jgi:hypothetical protein
MRIALTALKFTFQYLLNHVVMPTAARLPVVPIPEQCLATLMRNDVISNLSRLKHTRLFARHTDTIATQKAKRSFIPL